MDLLRILSERSKDSSFSIIFMSRSSPGFRMVSRLVFGSFEIVFSLGFRRVSRILIIFSQYGSCPMWFKSLRKLSPDMYQIGLLPFAV